LRVGLVATVLVIVAVLVLASTAGAAPTFGGDLTRPAQGSGFDCGSLGGPCTQLATVVRPGNLYPTAAPEDGVIVSFGIRVGAPLPSATFRLAKTSGLQAIGAGTGPTTSFASAGTYAVPARLPVQTGDLVGVDALDPAILESSCGGGGFRLFQPTLTEGVGQEERFNGTCGLELNATEEPDADGDGFGDETQDRCPGVPGPEEGCPAPAGTPPPSSPPSPLTQPTPPALTGPRPAVFRLTALRRDDDHPPGTRAADEDCAGIRSADGPPSRAPAACHPPQVDRLGRGAGHRGSRMQRSRTIARGQDQEADLARARAGVIRGPVRRGTAPLALGALLLLALLPSPSAAAAPRAGSILYAAADNYGFESEVVGGLKVDRSGQPHGPSTFLTRDPTQSEPAISPDGRTIAFVYRRPELKSFGPTIPESTGLAVMAADGTGATVIDPNAEDSGPAFSPDGQTIAFAREGAIFVIDRDGSGLRQVTDDQEGSDDQPTFSPDGDEIVFTRHYVPPRSNRWTSGIYSVPTSGGVIGTVIDGEAPEENPTFSPNGRLLAYDDQRFVVVADADGGDPHRLEGTFDRLAAEPRACVDPAFSPTSHEIAFLDTSTESKGFEAKLAVVLLSPRPRLLGTVARGAEDISFGSTIGAPAWGPVLE
jgi:hypothetical protein